MKLEFGGLMHNCIIPGGEKDIELMLSHEFNLCAHHVGRSARLLEVMHLGIKAIIWRKYYRKSR